MFPALSPGEVSASPPPFQRAGKDTEGHFPQSPSCPGLRDSTGQPACLLFHFILFQKAQLLIPQRSLSLVCRSSFSWLSAHRSPSLPDYVAGCTAAVGAVPFLKIAVYFPFCRTYSFQQVWSTCPGSVRLEIDDAFLPCQKIMSWVWRQSFWLPWDSFGAMKPAA